MPAWRAMACAGSWRSPVSMTTSRPSRANSSMADFVVARIGSDTSSDPANRPSIAIKIPSPEAATPCPERNFALPARTSWPSTRARMPSPAVALNSPASASARPREAREVHHGLAQGMFGAALGGCRQAQIGILDVRLRDARLAFGHSAGLIQNDGVHAAKFLERFAAFDQQSHARLRVRWRPSPRSAPPGPSRKGTR